MTNKPTEWAWKNARNDRIAKAGVTGKDDLKAKAVGCAVSRNWPGSRGDSSPARTCAISPQPRQH